MTKIDTKVVEFKLLLLNFDPSSLNSDNLSTKRVNFQWNKIKYHYQAFNIN